jgi:hypothetical protein
MPQWSAVHAPSGVVRAESAPAYGPREQATAPRRVGRVPHEPGRDDRCWPRPRADFGPMAREFKKFLFYFSIGFKLNSNLKNCI